VVDPTLDLDHAWLEGMAIKELFDSAADIVEGEHATLRAAIVGMQGHTHLHFACHGAYLWRDPERAGLDLNDGRLSVGDIVQCELSNARLVTMSACDTGISDVTVAPEEYLGLPAAFMQAGASGVLGALWPVDDLSTMLLMRRFYEAHISGGMDPAAALRTAQVAVRDATNAEVREIFLALAQSRVLQPGDVVRRGLIDQAIDRFTLHSDSEARPFAHPYYWAAFCFSGR
jgi:CHAT domain-containing protein